MSVISWLSRGFLGLRYRVRVRGADEVAARGNRSILFLPNHPALIDPPILMTALYDDFRPRALGDGDQIDRFFVRSVARHLRVIEMPDLMVSGPEVRHEVAAAVHASGEALRTGDNLVLYPSGRLQTSRREVLGAASAAHTVLGKAPDCRVVLVRITGLWGSRFSWAYGSRPEVAPVLLRGALAALSCGVLCMPRRRVEIELEEPEDFPRQGSLRRQNAYLEEFYAAAAQPAMRVPLTFWRGTAQRRMREPDLDRRPARGEQVPTAVSEAVFGRLRELTGLDGFDDDQRLADDLMMDSLQRAELVVWLEQEFGAPRGGIDSLVTVGDALQVAAGRIGDASADGEAVSAPSRWVSAEARRCPPRFFDGGDLVTAFLAAASSAPKLPILADQTAGLRTYRNVVTGMAALQPVLMALRGERIGLMLPATVGADVVFLSLLAAGKTPVMVNWTVGTRHLLAGLDSIGCSVVLTARTLVSKLEDQGVDLKPLRDRFVFLEDVATAIAPMAKVRALLRARFAASKLVRPRSESTAVVLFTSGSESVPKAVPLTDDNILTNLRDIFSRIRFETGDRLLSVLPPFHSFGLTAGVLMPLLGRIPTVHYPVPTDGAMLARMVEAYGVTLMGGTPTFLAGMLRSAEPGQLDSLRLAVTGGETFPRSLRDEFASACPDLCVLEGYGITECSPIVSINTPDDHCSGSVGKPLPSVSHRIVSPGGAEPLPAGAVGELLVSGPSVFGGYLTAGVRDPMVRSKGRPWYRTGDLVEERDDGFLFFRGRLKRFVKLGGEMVSLPAIEEALIEALEDAKADEGPAFAVEAASQGLDPEIVLFSTREIDRATANRAIREAGLSPLHAVRRIERLDELPVLGTGKIDYRRLRELASAAPAESM